MEENNFEVEKNCDKTKKKEEIVLDINNLSFSHNYEKENGMIKLAKKISEEILKENTNKRKIVEDAIVLSRKDNENDNIFQRDDLNLAGRLKIMGTLNIYFNIETIEKQIKVKENLNILVYKYLFYGLKKNLIKKKDFLSLKGKFMILKDYTKIFEYATDSWEMTEIDKIRDETDRTINYLRETFKKEEEFESIFKKTETSNKKVFSIFENQIIEETEKCNEKNYKLKVYISISKLFDTKSTKFIKFEKKFANIIKKCKSSNPNFDIRRPENFKRIKLCMKKEGIFKDFYNSKENKILKLLMKLNGIESHKFIFVDDFETRKDFGYFLIKCFSKNISSTNILKNRNKKRKNFDGYKVYDVEELLDYFICILSGNIEYMNLLNKI